jgi:hypothetical protein
VESLTALRERRAFERRLTPGRALRTPAEADAFPCSRGMLTRTGDCALPSLYEACREDPPVITAPWPAHPGGLFFGAFGLAGLGWQ